MMEKNKKAEFKDYTNRFMLWLSAGSLALFFIYIFCITFIAVPVVNQKYADTIIGFLAGTLVSTMINFYFGSSNASRALETISDHVKLNVEKKEQDKIGPEEEK